MVMELLQIRRQTKERSLKLKRLEYIIKSDIFEYLLRKSFSNQKEFNKLKTLILFCDLEGLKLWMEKHIGLEALSMDRLKERAKNLNITNWSRLPKDQLIMELKAYEQEN